MWGRLSILIKTQGRYSFHEFHDGEGLSPTTLGVKNARNNARSLRVKASKLPTRGINNLRRRIEMLRRSCRAKFFTEDKQP